MRRVFKTLNQIQFRSAGGISFADQHLADGIHRHSTRDVAGECAAHAVGDNQDESLIAYVEAG
jgi:hypothetical protein